MKSPVIPRAVPLSTGYPQGCTQAGGIAHAGEPGGGNTSPGTASGYASTIDALTVASFNMHGGLDAQGEPYDVPAAIGGLDAAIICLQEDWVPAGAAVRAGSDPVAAAGRAVGAAFHRAELCALESRSVLGLSADGGPGRLCISVLTALPVVSHEVIALGHGPGDSIPRVAQVVMLESPAGGLLRLVNCHLTFSVASPLQLRRLWRPLRSDPIPTVIAGDLNMPALVARRFPGLTELVRGATFPAHQPVLQLDHVLVSGGIRAGSGTVLPAAGSDHLPVRAQLLGLRGW
jgi:endonuclease/exonuclease/phosphatase family metal-dependent hydrolase